jgi:hypothetical protein
VQTLLQRRVASGLHGDQQACERDQYIHHWTSSEHWCDLDATMCPVADAVTDDRVVPWRPKHLSGLFRVLKAGVSADDQENGVEQ